MQWEKLERSYAALEATLHALKPEDRFNLILFNQAVTSFKPAPIAADPAAVQAALDFVRASKLRGGTDLLKALTAGLAQASATSSETGTTLVLLTDGGSDRGETVVPGKIAARYAAAWKASPHPPHTAVFAIGDDANIPLLRNLAHQNGFLEQVLSTESIDFHLQSFLAKLNTDPVKSLTLAAPQQASLVYPLDDTVYPGSIASWVGQYLPATNGSQDRARHLHRHGHPQRLQPITASTQAVLKAEDLTHPATSPPLGPGPRRRSPRPDRPRRRIRRPHRRDHPPVPPLQVRHPVHQLPRRAPRAPAPARHPSRRPRPAHPYRRPDHLRHRPFSRLASPSRSATSNPKTCKPPATRPTASGKPVFSPPPT